MTEAGPFVGKTYIRLKANIESIDAPGIIVTRNAILPANQYRTGSYIVNIDLTIPVMEQECDVMILIKGDDGIERWVKRDNPTERPRKRRKGRRR